MTILEQDIEVLAEHLFQAYYAETYPGVVGNWRLVHEDTRAGWRAAAAFVLASRETAAKRQARQKTRVFYLLDTSSMEPGWYYQIDMADPVGPFTSKPEATRAMVVTKGK